MSWARLCVPAARGARPCPLHCAFYGSTCTTGKACKASGHWLDGSLKSRLHFNCRNIIQTTTWVNIRSTLYHFLWKIQAGCCSTFLSLKPAFSSAEWKRFGSAEACPRPTLNLAVLHRRHRPILLPPQPSIKSHHTVDGNLPKPIPV